VSTDDPFNVVQPGQHRQPKRSHPILATAGKTVVVVLTLLAIVAGCSAFFIGTGDTNGAASSVTDVTLDAPAPNTDAGIGDGTWEVGVDVQPGKYKTSGPRPDGYGCYWERSKDLDGGFDSILSNDNLTGPGIVRIKKTDATFTTNGCSVWIRQ
jgi:hypothetical protein